MTLSLPKVALAAVSLMALAACNSETGGRNPARAYAPIPADTLSLMAQKDTDRSAPVLLRAYKKESEIELWKQAKDGRYVLVKTYPICRWSGQLGPKTREGDRQVPEGFYTITPAQMNPNSAYWLAFNVGYPNALERAQGRGGGDIMVHGTCSSRGCFAMTDKQIEEIYAVVREAFNGGQRAVQFQSYPFRMTAENLARFRHDPNIAFWRNLKEGNDHFEVTKAEPRVGYCGGKYVFDAESGRTDPTAPCSSIAVNPSIAAAVAAKQKDDDQKIAELVARGTPAIRVQYADGGQNPSFSNTGLGSADARSQIVVAYAEQKTVGDVSRPDAINDVEEYAVDESGNRKAPKPEPVKAEAPAVKGPAVAVASASAKPVKGAKGSAQAGTAVAAAPAAVQAPLVPAEPSSGALTAFGALFGSSSKPAAADSSTASTVAKATAKSDKPFYKRWFGLGGDDAPADAAPAPVQPASAPIPSRKQAAADGKAKVALIQPDEAAGSSTGQ